MSLTEAPIVEPEAPPSGRVPMSELSPALVAGLGPGAVTGGVLIGVLTSNLLFAYLMLGLPIAVVLLFAAFAPKGSTSRPSRGKYGAGLPVAALVVSVLGGSVLGIVLGHVSRHLIRVHGGDGEKVALTACVVGYAALTAQAAVLLWVATGLLSS